VIASLTEMVPANVKAGDVLSEMLYLLRGVPQGCPFSTMSFCMFIDALVAILTDAGFGIELVTVLVAILLFCDDLLLISPSADALSRMLAVTARYGQLWLLPFAPFPKSAVVVVGGSNAYDGVWWHFGASPPLRTVQHMKILSCTKRLKRATDLMWMLHNDGHLRGRSTIAAILIFYKFRDKKRDTRPLLLYLEILPERVH
jgi:hypothetical protein